MTRLLTNNEYANAVVSVDSDGNIIGTGPASGAFNPIGAHSSGTTISAATTLTPAEGATKLLIQALTKNVRFTLDGTAPEAAKGFQIAADDAPFIIPIGEDTVVKVIQEAATASLQYQWGE
jgi:hypothetical protein